MATEDLTGRSRLARNIGTSYASHFVFIIFGFVMPRAIDGYVGQEALGVWDFGWAFVSYMNLAMMGIGSSVNRFVARYRASGDTDALNRTVSTIVVVQVVIAALVLVAALGLAWLVPQLLGNRLGEYQLTAAWIIACLGGALAVEMAFDAWRGVLSGCHRWDYYNGISAGGHTASCLIMLATLASGGGLREMAIVYLITTLGTEILRYFVARRVCPELVIRASFFNRQDSLKVIRFGLKTIMLALPSIVTTQTVNLFVMAYLGPAALAVIARPLALMRHIGTLTGKYAYVLTPTAGSLQSQQKQAELREFALQSARAGWLISLPPIVLMFVTGDLILDVWMGADYASWTVCAVLSAGYLLPISQGPLLRVLVGLDAHGSIAKVGTASAGVLLAAGIATVTLVGWSLTNAALLIALPIGAGMGVTVLVAGFRYLDLSVSEYFRHALAPALRLLLTIAAVLTTWRILSPYASAVTVFVGIALTAVTTLTLQRRDIVRALIAVRA
jgi:O-antigen/teichoic acid export membrane protein